MATVTEKLRFLLETDASGAIKGFERVGDAADKNLGKTQSRIDKAALSMQKWGAGAIAAGGVIGAGLFKAASAFQNLALEAGKFSDATGVAVEDASRWIEVTGDMGVEASSLQAALGRLNRTISASPETLAEFGVAVKRAQDGTVDVSSTFLSLIDRLNAIPDPARRAQVATELLGRGWQELAEVIGTGSGSLREALASVSDAKVIDESEVAKAKEFRASLDEMKDAAQDLALAVGQGAVPVLGALAKAAGGAVSMFGALNDVTNGAAGAVASAGAVALVAGGSVVFLAGKLTSARTAFASMGTAAKVSAGAVAGATIVYGLYASAKAAAAARTAELRSAIDLEIAGHKDAAIAAQVAWVQNNKLWIGLERMNEVLASGEVTLDEWVRAVRGEQVPAVEAAIAANSNLSMRLNLQRKAYEEQTEASRAAKRAADDLSDSTKDASRWTIGWGRSVGRSKEEIDEANRVMRIYGDYLDHVAKEAQEAADAVNNWTDAVLAQADSQLGLERAIDAGEEALDRYNDALRKGDPEEVSDALRDLKGDYLAIASAAGVAAVDGLGPYASEGDKADAKNRAMIDSLSWLAGSLEPGSALRVYLEEYIKKLQSIPTSVETSVGIRGPSEVFLPVPGRPVPGGGDGGRRRGSGAGSPGRGNAKGAAGAIVTQATEALIGEAGPEAVVPLNKMPGASPLPSGLGGAAPGGFTFAPTINVQAPTGSDPGAFARAIGDALRGDRRLVQELAGALTKYGYR